MRAAVCLLCVAAWAQTPQPGAVQGRVVDTVTAQPIAGAEVTLEPQGVMADWKQAVTGEDGAFAFGELPPGEYRIRAQAQTHPAPMSLPPLSFRVDVRAGETTSDVTLRLSSFGSVTGRVLDDAGEPLPMCRTVLLPALLGEAPTMNLTQGATAGGGAFRLSAVADRYLIAVRCLENLPGEHLLAQVGTAPFPPGAIWQSAYYPDSPAIDGAAEVSVPAGAEIPLEFHLRPIPVQTVRGVLHGTAGQAQAGVILIPDGQVPGNSIGVGWGMVDQRDGSFTITRVPAGSYHLYGTLQAEDGTIVAAAAQALTIDNTDPRPVTLILQPAITVRGRVEGGRPADGRPGTISLVRAVGNWLIPGIRSTPVEADGTFQLSGIPPGHWRVRFEPAGDSPYAESIQFGRTLPPDAELDLTAAPTDPLIIQLGSRKRTVRYHLEPAGPASVAGWQVIAMPVGPDAPYVLGAAREGDTLEARPLPPGRYTLFAIPGNLYNAARAERLLALLARQIKPVAVGGDTTGTLPVKVLHSEEIQKIIESYIAGDPQ